jgi:hypothetical protein
VRTPQEQEIPRRLHELEGIRRSEAEGAVKNRENGRRLPPVTLTVPIVAKVLGVGRSRGYEAARCLEWPRVPGTGRAVRIASAWVAETAGLTLEELAEILFELFGEEAWS